MTIAEQFAQIHKKLCPEMGHNRRCHCSVILQEAVLGAHDMTHAPVATGAAVYRDGIMADGGPQKDWAVLSWWAIKGCIRHWAHACALHHWDWLALEILVAGLVVVEVGGGVCGCICSAGLVDSIKACMGHPGVEMMHKRYKVICIIICYAITMSRPFCLREAAQSLWRNNQPWTGPRQVHLWGARLEDSQLVYWQVAPRYLVVEA